MICRTSEWSGLIHVSAACVVWCGWQSCQPGRMGGLLTCAACQQVRTTVTLTASHSHGGLLAESSDTNDSSPSCLGLPSPLPCLVACLSLCPRPCSRRGSWSSGHHRARPGEEAQGPVCTKFGIPFHHSLWVSDGKVEGSGRHTVGWMDSRPVLLLVMMMMMMIQVRDLPVPRDQGCRGG